MSWGELARRTFFITPGLPKIGWFQRIKELADTVPNPREYRVAISLLDGALLDGKEGIERP